MKKSPPTLDPLPPLAPHERTALPFSVVKERGACLLLRYVGVYTHPDGTEKSLPYTHTVGDPAYPGGASPLGMAVLALLRLYRELEQHDGDCFRRAEELADRLKQAEAEIATLRQSLAGHESRAVARRGGGN